MPPPPKRARTEPPSKQFLSLEEANDLKDEIAQLDSEYQFKILEILQANGEKLVPDDNGEVEIEIVKCSEKSVSDVKALLAFVQQEKGQNVGGANRET